jgi:hypothetical protein
VKIGSIVIELKLSEFRVKRKRLVSDTSDPPFLLSVNVRVGEARYSRTPRE